MASSWWVLLPSGVLAMKWVVVWHGERNSHVGKVMMGGSRHDWKMEKEKNVS